MGGSEIQGRRQIFNQPGPLETKEENRVKWGRQKGGERKESAHLGRMKSRVEV